MSGATHSNANTLEHCLQQRLNAVLAGDNVREHANLPGLVQLALGRGNWQKIADDKHAIELFVTVAESVIKKRLHERGREFVGATLKLIDDERAHVAEGSIIANGVAYNISITFPNKASCLVHDISIHGAFTLRDWVAGQPEMQKLMKEYKMAR